MRSLTLTRSPGGHQGTLGTLTGFGLALFSLELPWRENQKGVSRILSGSYFCRFCFSPAFHKELYRLEDVPGRSGVLIHAGNWAGDVALGFKSNSQGCILLGQARGQALGQLAVLNSAAAMRVLHSRMGGEPFILHIIGGES